MPTTFSKTCINVLRVVLPFRLAHLALLCVQIIAALNGLLTDAALAEEEVELSPLTLAVMRSVVAAVICTVVREMSLRLFYDEKSVQEATDRWAQHSNNNSNEQPSAVVTVIPAVTYVSSPYSYSSGGGGVVIASGSPFSVASYFSPTLSPKSTPPPPLPGAHLDIKSHVHVTILGFVVISLDLLCYYYGLWLTDAATFSALQSLIPTATFIIGLSVGLDTFTCPKVLAIIFVFVGNFCLSHVEQLFIGDSSQSVFRGGGGGRTYYSGGPTPMQYTAGIFLTLVAVICFASYLVFQRPLVARMTFTDFLFFLYISGACGLILVSLVPREHIVAAQVFGGSMSLRSWLTILYAGGAHATLDYFLLGWATKRCGSSLVAAIMNGLQPLVGIILKDVYVLMTASRESAHLRKLDAFQLVGAGTVVWGVYCAILATIHHHHGDEEEEDNGDDEHQQQADATTTTTARTPPNLEEVHVRYPSPK